MGSKQRNVYYVTSSNDVKLYISNDVFSWIPMVMSVIFNTLSDDIPSRIWYIDTYAPMFYQILYFQAELNEERMSLHCAKSVRI